MADETQNTANAQNSQSSGVQDAAQAQANQEKTFSQTEFNRQLKQRLDEERAKFADYDQLKKKAEELESANKSEMEKALERANKAESALKAKEVEAKRRELVANAKVAALGLKFKADKIGHVIKLVDITDESTDDTISTALAALAKEMPELLDGKAPPPETGAVNPGKAAAGAPPNETNEQRLARIRGGGGFNDWLAGATVEFNPAVNAKQQTK